MEPNALETATDRLRALLREKVPDLLLQAECGGGLELPTPLPWGFASVPTMYELANTAERELYELQAQQRERGRHGHRADKPPPPPQGKRPGVSEAGREDDPSGGREQRRRRSPAVQQRADESRRHQGPEAVGRGSNGEPPAPEGSPSGDGRRGDDVRPDGFDAVGAAQRPPSSGTGGEGRRNSCCMDEAAPGADAVNGADAAAADGTSGDAGRASAGGEGHETGGASTRAEGATPEAGGDSGGRDAGLDPMCDDTTEVPVAAQRAYACRTFLDSLAESRTFRSPHCEGAMVEVMGMAELYEGLAGSTLGPPPGSRELEALRNLLKDHINARWALEAVKQGVAAAKQGSYADAHKAYARALELDPRSAEAYVARGAAHANQRAFGDAERDLRHALTLDPRHSNAAAYLEAVLRKVEEQRQQLEALEEERKQVLARQRDRDRDRDRERRRRTAEADALEAGATAEESPGAAPGRPVSHADPRYGSQQGPPSAPGRLQREPIGGAAAAEQGAGWPTEGGAGRRRRGSDSSSGSDSSVSSSGSDDGSIGTPGRDPSLQQPANEDIRRALEVVLKARKLKRKSKHKKHKKKHKKSKRRRRD